MLQEQPPIIDLGSPPGAALQRDDASLAGAAEFAALGDRLGRIAPDVEFQVTYALQVREALFHRHGIDLSRVSAWCSASRSSTIKRNPGSRVPTRDDDTIACE